jgi:ABC-type lipoprotein export system ATPase subunit
MAAAQPIGVRRSCEMAARTVEALAGVSTAFTPGTFAAVTGPSVSGKSMLPHCAARLDLVTSGEVLIGGTALAGLPDRALITARTGVHDHELASSGARKHVRPCTAHHSPEG